MKRRFFPKRWRFRLSSLADRDLLYEIWHRSVSATHDFVCQSDLHAIALQVKNEYLPGRSLLVAMDGRERPVGFMGTGENRIESLFIDPAHHRRGLGRAFIEAAAAQSPYLEVEVNLQNHRAVRFYEAMGFIAYAAHPKDEDGRPYPILFMRRGRQVLAGNGGS